MCSHVDTAASVSTRLHSPCTRLCSRYVEALFPLYNVDELIDADRCLAQASPTDAETLACLAVLLAASCRYPAK